MDPAWEEYRRRRRALWLALLLVPLWMFPGSIISSVLLGRGLDAEWVAFLFVAAPLVINLMVAYLRWMFWLCPRCGRPFHFGWFTYGNPFALRCVHCGLAKWSPGSEPRSVSKGNRTDPVPEIAR